MARPNRKYIPNVTIEGARLLFRNFSGKEGDMNNAGDRNFNVVLDPEVVPRMLEDGWNIKTLKGKEEGDPDTYILKVKLKFKKPTPEVPEPRQPRVILVTSRGRTQLGEEDVSVLDWAEIVNTDLIVSPYIWEMRGNTGITAYVQDLFVTIQENELDLKYADVPLDSAKSAVLMQNPTSYYED
jgi:hypothetical protein